MKKKPSFYTSHPKDKGCQQLHAAAHHQYSWIGFALCVRADLLVPRARQRNQLGSVCTTSVGATSATFAACFSSGPCSSRCPLAITATAATAAAS